MKCELKDKLCKISVMDEENKINESELHSKNNAIHRLELVYTYKIYTRTYTHLYIYIYIYIYILVMIIMIKYNTPIK